MIKKRGQSLPLNTIIIAIIVVTVLVVLIMIFTGQIRLFTTGLSDCQAQGGSCVSDTACPDGFSKAPLSKCDSGVCCIKTGEKSCADLGGSCDFNDNLHLGSGKCSSSATRLPASCPSYNPGGGYVYVEVDCCK